MSAPRRVLVVTSGALFVRGGHLVIADQLCSALRRAGHDAEVLITPQNRFGRQLAAYLATRLTDVSETADGHPVDQVISLRFPSYAVRHPRHVCWLNHRMREYYDLWERFAGQLSWQGRLKERARRRLLHAADHWLLTRNVTRLVAQSRTVQERLRCFGGMTSDLLYPPPPERPYRTDGYGDYVFTVSRLDPLKRLDLLIEAAALMSERSLRLKIAGEGPEAGRLAARVRELQLQDRVELLGPVSEPELLRHYAECRAVYFGPLSEDYGFVTLEAFRSRKAVLTTNDSGGPAELVEDGVSGWIAEPSPQAVARQLDALAADRALAEARGAAALEQSRQHTWERAVRELLA